MLYSEFIQGTKCKDTTYNYYVYQDLEVLYMNSNISKEKIYEYGKKLVDNSLTLHELKLIEEIKDKINILQSLIDECKSVLCHEYLYTQSYIKLIKGDMKHARWQIAQYKKMIKEIKGE